MIPIALSGGTVLAVFLMVVIVLGYVVIWALWHFVFREAGDHVTGERPATVPPKAHDAWSRERSSAGRPGSEVPRDARRSAASSEDDRQA